MVAGTPFVYVNGTHILYYNFHFWHILNLLFLIVNIYVIVNPQLEFRAFVHNNQLTAISQYDCILSLLFLLSHFDIFAYLSYYPYLVTNKAKIQKQILSFFINTLQPALQSYGNYVVDFFVGEEEKEGESNVKVVELNSFESWTGGCLFSWTTDRDIILNGPLEMRVVETIPSSHFVDDYFPPQWKDLIVANLGEYLTKKEEKDGKEKKGDSKESGCIAF